MIKIFDTHAHYDDEAFDEDRDALLGRLRENGIYAVTNIGASLASCRETVRLVAEHEFMYGAIGVHPSEVADLESEGAFDELKKMCTADSRIVAVGEIGLDYHYEDTDKELQHKWFVRQLELARELELPVVIHSREAVKDTIDIMKAQRANELGGVVHCFSYEKEVARTFLDMGYFFGIGGVLTFKNSRKLREVVEYVPLDMLVLETDAPYLAPVPNRGHRNSSLNIPYVAEEIAAIKNISVDEVYEATWNNAHRLYHIG